ncbi:signal recognition particle 9 kDa protein-domain-containing protein [Tuber borchii]|uniref:Signal recognition particle 9 kDa protein-domain-containing protein n=1 Tax=Tuber borchii TaxID=42251 RepID=A0A2T6ZU60_TUBBO|nr:signal recognition particle 9 kDa protein-domain-containing protein [Tuber borchii]
MKLTKTPQEFVDESLLLLKARPSTTRITTSYHAAPTGKGKLTLKTYDPVSGALVKFRTSKIAVVGRLVAGLNRLGRQQAGVPEPAVIGKNLFTTLGTSGWL